MWAENVSAISIRSVPVSSPGEKAANVEMNMVKRIVFCCFDMGSIMNQSSVRMM
jgi:hypothetical protein